MYNEVPTVFFPAKSVQTGLTGGVKFRRLRFGQSLRWARDVL